MKESKEAGQNAENQFANRDGSIVTKTTISTSSLPTGSEKPERAFQLFVHG
jgi:hypothetical protein